MESFPIVNQMIQYNVSSRHSKHSIYVYMNQSNNKRRMHTNVFRRMEELLIYRSELSHNSDKNVNNH